MPMRSVPFVREILLHFLSTEGPAAGSGLLTRKADRQNRTSYLRIYVFAYLRDLTPVPYLTDVARIEAGGALDSGAAVTTSDLQPS
jgi:hypothetical protein